METKLTSTIKKATHSYKRKMSKLRTIRYADEVKTPKGIVDSIRFEDIDIGPIKCKSPPCKYPERKEKNCKGCIYRKHKIQTKIITTCYEVKITMSDFHSGHGKNFFGNENFYCVPKEIADKILNEIGEKSPIGILAWNGKELRCYKPAKYQEIPKELTCLLLFYALKKWCDGTQKLD